MTQQKKVSSLDEDEIKNWLLEDIDRKYKRIKELYSALEAAFYCDEGWYEKARIQLGFAPEEDE